MLKIGDKVVYPMHGAGVITAVEECEVLGEVKSYYVLKLPVGNVKVMIPTDNLDKTGIRDIITVDKLKEVLAVLSAKPDKSTGSWNKRFHTNLERMKSGNLCDVAAVARNLIRQDSKKRISSGERRLMDLAKQILISELVYAMDKEPSELETWLNDVVAKRIALEL